MSSIWPRSTKERVVMAVAFSVVLAISAWFAWSLRFAPDENSHLTVVRHHAHHVELASWTDFEYGGQRGHVYHLFSPVAYLPYVPFQWLQEWLGPVEGAVMPDRFVTRLGGLVVAAAQLALTIALVRRIARRASLVHATVVALAVNLVPQLRYIHAYVTADGMTILAGTACFVMTLRVLQQERLRLGDAFVVGATLALAAHARYNLFLVAAVLLVVYAFRALRQHAVLRERLRLVGAAVAIPTLLAGSFHLVVYDELRNGHFVPSVDNEELLDSTFQGEIEREPSSLTSLAKTRVRQAPLIWEGIWAQFTRYPAAPEWLRFVLLAACVLGAVGLFVRRSTAIVAPFGRGVALLAFSAFAATWAFMASQWRFSQWGRYLLPAVPAALAALVVGTAVLVARFTRPGRSLLWSAAGWATLLLAVNVWAMTRVAA